jgi:hypothetical protein
VPGDKPVHEVARVEVRVVEETVGERQRHRSVVGPPARLQPERPAADHVEQHRLHWLGGELQRGPDGVAHCKADECADGAVEKCRSPLTIRVSFHCA